jgi:CheY-like chemotaxis protein
LARQIRPRVLVVEDHDSLRLYVSAVLSKNGYRVLEAGSEPEALDLLSRVRVHALFVDLDSPLLDGAGVLAAYRSQHGIKAPLVVCPPIEAPSPNLATAVLIRKPFSVGRLLGAVRQSFDDDHLSRAA